MAVANDPYIGAWKIVEVISLCGSGCQMTLEGTEMKLDESGDVTWILPEGGDANCALFRCETYDLVTDHSFNNDRRSLMLAAVHGHAIVFKVDHPTPQDLMVLTCEDWCILQCQRVACRQPLPDHPFSLAGLLDCPVYSDLTLTAADGAKFPVHSLVLSLLAPSVDWRAERLPGRLPAAALGALVHYLYTESLPAGLPLAVAETLAAQLRPLDNLAPLAALCARYVTNVTLRDDLRRLVHDMHACCQTVCDRLSEAVGQSRRGAESVFACPGQLSALVRLCLRQVALGLSKLALTFDLYGRHEMSLSAEERRQVIWYAQSRLPQFLSQLQRILQGLRALLSSASQAQRAELAARSVSELEWLTTTVSSLLEESKAFLEAALNSITVPDGPATRRDGSLTYALRSRTLLCLQTLLERLTRANIYILQKREYLSAVGESGGARLVARSTERLLDELPSLMTCAALEDAAGLADQHINWREFKFYFVATASRVHHIMELLRGQPDTVRPLLDHLRLLVGSDELDRTLEQLGLLDTRPAASQRPPHGPAANHDSTDNPTDSRAANQEAVNSATADRVAANGGGTNQSTKDAQRTNQDTGDSRRANHRAGQGWITNESPSSAVPPDETSGLSLVSAVTRPPLSHDSELARRCHRLFESGRDTDLQFTVRGDPVLPSLLGGHGAAISEQQPTVLLAHAPIVAARSAWLRRALTSGMRESIDRQISICDASPPIFRSMLEFLYCGHVTPENWPPEQLMELMVLADRYELDDLKHSCESLLETHIDEDSVFCLLSMAEQYNARKLKSSALEFVATNPEVVQSDLFLELGPALQAEVEETAVWAPPRYSTDSDLTGSRRRPSELQMESPVDNAEELVNLTRGIHLRQASRSSSSSAEEPPGPPAGRLEACLHRLRSIVGEDVTRAELIRVILAADYDVNRALNFFFSA